MENSGGIFEEYTRERTMAERMKNPKFWIKYILLIAFLIFMVIIYKSFKNTWSQADVENSIEIVSVETGWIEGKSELREKETRILPFVSFKVKNKGANALHFVNFECVFEFREDGTTQTSGFYSAFSSPLAVGEMSGKIFIKGVNGYTASAKEAFYENKDKWRKVNAKIFARTHGSTHVRVGGLYPVDQNITGFRKDINIVEHKGISDKVEIMISDSGWVYKMLEGKNVIVYPSITFKIKNNSNSTLSKLGFKGIFRFEGNNERQNFGYPAVRGRIEPGSLSNEITMRSEYGINASSLQALYNNTFEWDEVTVKIMIKGMETGYESLGVYPVKNKVKGVRIVNERPE